MLALLLLVTLDIIPAMAKMLAHNLLVTLEIIPVSDSIVVTVFMEK